MCCLFLLHLVFLLYMAYSVPSERYPVTKSIGREDAVAKIRTEKRYKEGFGEY